MAVRNLLYKRSVDINDFIKVVIPSVGEVVADEDNYYSLVSALTAMPIDMMVQLDDAGVDFTSINEYELFLLTFEGIKTRDTHLIFGDLDLTNFKIAINEQNGLPLLIDEDSGIRIDRAIYERIADTLRTIHHLKKDNRKPANVEAREYLIERARKKMRRRKKKAENSYLESLIIAMVNVEQFKYDYEGTKRLSVYQFNESVQQIIKKVNYDNILHGIYAGTVSAKDCSQSDLNWLTHN